MGFLVAWIAVVGGAAALLTGWLFGPATGVVLPRLPAAGFAALMVVFALLLIDAARELLRRRRR